MKCQSDLTHEAACTAIHNMPCTVTVQMVSDCSVRNSPLCVRSLRADLCSNVNPLLGINTMLDVAIYSCTVAPFVVLPACPV